MARAKKGVHGYKVFGPDWTCAPDPDHVMQYSCPGVFEIHLEDGEKLKCCKRGMHFCKTLNDCFSYYSFDPCNKIAEVVALGKISKKGDKYCTDKLEIIREISWMEALEMLNSGSMNTGRGNSGSRNTGNRNAGHCNTGDQNKGNQNTGHCNTGHWNAGNWNSGNWNTGDRNTGNWNSGYLNSGRYNAGDQNTGDLNTGNGNAGNLNSGNWNIGNRNTGDWNAASGCTGCFNSKAQPFYMFNRPTDWTWSQWWTSTARLVLMTMPNQTSWVSGLSVPSDEELISLRQDWWNSLREISKKAVLDLPNFDPEVFRECTGIQV